MTDGSEPTTDSGEASRRVSTPDTPPASDRIGTYDTENGVVFYDMENPLAWVQTADTVEIDEMV